MHRRFIGYGYAWRHLSPMSDPRLPARVIRPAVAVAGLLVSIAALVTSWPPAEGLAAGVVRLSLVATTDLHGYVFPRDGAGGLAVFGGYLANLRAARAADAGGVVLVDAGDTWLGGIESDMSEGAVVVDAYNALAYSAAAVGNHDLEFGPIDAWWAAPGVPADRRGALKARAAQARFPFLAANLTEGAAGTPVAWPNVQPSAMVEVAGVKVGLVGVMTLDALSLTLAPNVAGLVVTPLVPAIVREARALRVRGAQVVVVVAHAGGSCATFDAPDDLTGCDDTAEIVHVARALPPGLVNAIAAGHTHDAMAHRVNGIPIVQAFSWGRAFARVDLDVDTARIDGAVAASTVHAPTLVCAWTVPSSSACAPGASDTAVRPRYEGRQVAEDPAVAAAMAPALSRVAAVRARPLGAALEAPVPRIAAGGESPLGHLFAEAIRAVVPGATVGLSYGAGPGGLRADLAAGPVTVGALYDVFPFDNAVEARWLTGAELARLAEDHLSRPRWGARSLGLAGVQVRVTCDGSRPVVALLDDGARPIAAEARLLVALPDFLAARARRVGLGEAVAVAPPALVREAADQWMRRARPAVPSTLVDRWHVSAGAAPCVAG